MSDQDANKALVRRYFDEFFNRRDLSGVEDVCATDYTEHAVAPFGQEEPGRADGPRHLESTVRWLTDQFPDVSHPRATASRPGRRTGSALPAASSRSTGLRARTCRRCCSSA